MTDSVWITAVGAVLPGAIGADAMVERLESGLATAAPLERFDTSRWGRRLACTIDGFRPRDFVPPARLRRMNELSKMGVAATRMALDASGFTPGLWSRDRVGVAMGTMFGPVRTSVDYMDAYMQHGPSLAPPQLFAESVANAPGSHVAIEFGFEGFNLTCTQREISFATALLQATLQMQRGLVDAAVVGGVDELNEIVFEVLARAGALAHDEGSGEIMRPLDRRHNGFIAGEGALTLLLEREPRSQPLARVRGIGIARDASASIHDWGQGAYAVVRACHGALAQAGIDAAAVDAIYLSANGRPACDRLEAAAVTALYPSRVPAVVACKAVFGEYAGASGAPLLAASFALRDQKLHPSCGFEQPMEDVRVEPVTELTDSQLENVLVINTSAGGGIVAVVLGSARS